MSKTCIRCGKLYDDAVFVGDTNTCRFCAAKIIKIQFSNTAAKDKLRRKAKDTTLPVKDRIKAMLLLHDSTVYQDLLLDSNPLMRHVALAMTDDEGAILEAAYVEEDLGLKYNMVQKLQKPDSLYLLKAYLSDDDPSIEFIDERLEVLTDD